MWIMMQHVVNTHKFDYLDLFNTHSIFSSLLSTYTVTRNLHLEAKMSSQNDISGSFRPLANFSPRVWGNHFLSNAPKLYVYLKNSRMTKVISRNP
ncbi:hypothetical protein RIF29_31183 [Crotalaria pallida]|uniref:Uncharacterized protein n=1 Tax=Crotalaria pallida TaxID=3830 RepID=A0AAN9EGY6_CROPI